jgi:hypothetical protein
MFDAADLPDDIAELQAMLIAATAREVRKDERIERLEKLVAAFKQAASVAGQRKAVPSSSIWPWKIWKQPSRPFTQRTKLILLQTSEFPNRVRPIAGSSKASSF